VNLNPFFLTLILEMGKEHSDSLLLLNKV
jgi:hypothetical protein